MAYFPPKEIPGHNYLANGNLRYWPFGNGTSIFEGTPSPLHWASIGNTNAVLDQDTALLSSFSSYPKPPYAYKATSLSTVLNTGHTYAISTSVEGPTVQAIAGQKLTVSFWVYATTTGTYSFCMRSNGAPSSGYSYVSTYTVNASETWEKKTFVFDHSAADPAGWTTALSSFGMFLYWTIYVGSAVTGYPTAALDQWVSSTQAICAPFGTQTNGFNGTGKIFALAQVKLEVGPKATNFVELPAEMEAARLGRFFENFASQNNSDPIGTGFAISTSSARILLPFSYPKFSAVSFSGVTSGDTQLFDGVTATDVTSASIDFRKIDDVRDRAWMTVNVSGTPLTQFRPYVWRWKNNGTLKSFYII